MADYSLLPVGVRRTSDGVAVRPQDGQAWETYIAWLAAGGVPDPYVPPAPPPETLQEAKARKRAEILRARDLQEYGTFTYDGKVFDADIKSTVRINGAFNLSQIGGGPPFSVQWTLADNSVVTLNAAQVMGLGQTLGQHVQTVHAKGRALNAQIDAAATVDQVNAINW